MSITEEQAKKLREPFRAEQIGKLPKPTKKENEKGRCGECGGWHGLPAVHLDYVGHAATTDRLLEVDPSWSWEPMAVGANGEPLLTNGGLWIWLTVCGVRRPGFGDGESMKEVIGDAIRNAAMRFGVALDLWSKEDLHGFQSAAASPDAVGGPSSEQTRSGPTPSEADAHGLQSSRADAVLATDALDDSGATLLSFGKHKNTAIKDVPRAYLEWWCGQETPKTDDLKRQRAAVELFLGLAPVNEFDDSDVPF